MSIYNSYFIFHDGEYSLGVILNNQIIATDNKEEAMTEATKLESKLCKLIKIEFNSEIDDIKIEIQENPYFNEIKISEYLMYDFESHEDNPVTKKQFLALLKKDYQEYLEKHKRLTFEANAYGITKESEKDMAIDYSQKKFWTVELLEETLKNHTVLKSHEKGNYDLLWQAKLDCEKAMGHVMRPAK